MKTGMIDFPVNESERCPFPGNHRHLRWPDQPICGGHYDFVNEVLRLLEVISGEARIKWIDEAMKRNLFRNMKVLGTPIES